MGPVADTSPGAATRRPARATGLAPWLFALLFSVVGFHGLFAVLYSVGPEPLKARRVAHDLALIESFRSRSADFKVALIGNSMLRYATLPEAELDRIAAGSGADVAFIRLLKNNAVFEHFDYALEPLLAAEPDVIVIQAPLLVQEPVSGPSKYGFFQQYIRWRLIGGTISGDDPHEIQHELVCHRDVSNQMHAAFRDHIQERRTYDLDGGNAHAARAFVARAAEKGIPVIAVTVPVTERLAAWYAATGDLAVVREEALHRASGGWAFAESLTDELFCDPMHLDREGRQLYSEWLVRRLDEYRAGQREASLAANIMESS